MNEKELKQLAYDLGADLCGIAGIDRFDDAPQGYHPLDVLPTCQSVIVFAKRFPAGTLACQTAVPYTVARNVLTATLDRLSVDFCIEMEKQGILAVPTRTNSSEWDERTERWRNIVSAKHAAQAAGLGSIGRHSLLITPQFGSMVWLTVVLTEEKLTPDPLLENICDNCNLCVEACPVNALENQEMKQMVCQNYAFGEVKKDWRISCHKCRDICPYNLGSENKNLRR